MTYRDPYLPDGDRADERVTIERVERTPVRPVAVDADLDDRPVVVGPSPTDTIRRLVWLMFGVLQGLIVLRIVLLLLGANEGNEIVAGIVGLTDPFVEPFRGMFALDEVSGAGGSELDIAGVVALVAWTLVEALVLGLLGLADRRATVA